MNLSYFFCPLLAWFIAGSLKFAINSFRSKRLSFDQMGYGGLPSTHTAIVTSTTTLIALQEGLSSPFFGIAFTFTIIIIIDAIGLRRQMGKHARAINQLTQDAFSQKPLKETMGHKMYEMLAGFGVGVIVGWVMY
jgi:uncharacterized protein